MALRDLDRIEAVIKDGERQALLMMQHDWPEKDEALLHVQALIKGASVSSHAKSLVPEWGYEPEVRLVTDAEPPASILESLGTFSVRVVVGDEEQPAQGKPARIANVAGRANIGALQEANATAFATRTVPPPPRGVISRLRGSRSSVRLDYSIDSLQAVDSILAARRAEAGLGQEEASDDFADGDLAILAGAYVGEVLRRNAGGRWLFDPSTPMMYPVHFSVASNGSVVNPIGKVEKFLRNGPEDSVHFFAQAVLRP